MEYKENEWLPCDESGRIDDGYGNEPNATVAYLSSLEGSREERAFELAKNEYLAWLEHKADRYTTVYGYIGYEWTGRAHGSLADALATLAVQRWLEQWLVAE